eukprot:tig00020554_g10815.t1
MPSVPPPTPWAHFTEYMRQAFGTEPPSLETPHEFRQVGYATAAAAAAGVIIGSARGSRQASDLASGMPRSRQVFYQMMAASFGQAGSLGLRLGGYAGIFSAAEVMLAMHRQTRDPLNSAAAGFASGAFIGITRGSRESAKIAAVGTALGGLLGCVKWGLEKLDESLPEETSPGSPSSPVTEGKK